MAELVEGKLTHSPLARLTKTGEFDRPASTFRNGISPEEASPDRFHLYVSYACPWAHRTLIVRKLKKLDQLISVSVTNPFMGENGWTFDGENDPKYLAVVYLAADKKFTGKITVPVLWDKKDRTIVNNESADIVRILNSAFDHLTGSEINLYPEELENDIDEINELVYENINNGVYRAGFASTQRAYEEACHNLFRTLETLEERLGITKFLVGDLVTEADIRLFTTLYRFDPVYHGHFKCNLKMLRDFPNLYAYLKCLYQHPAFKETCHLDHIKEHYYKSHDSINPSRIVPLGPIIDLESPHGRGELKFYRTTPDPSSKPQRH